MYIYNITVNIDNDNHNIWLVWIEDYVHKILNTQKFTSAKMTEIMVENEEGRTYSIQFTANNLEDLNFYKKHYENEFRIQAHQKFGEKMMYFSTDLKFVKEFFANNINN